MSTGSLPVGSLTNGEKLETGYLVLQSLEASLQGEAQSATLKRNAHSMAGVQHASSCQQSALPAGSFGGRGVMMSC
jgi:hypothetical protein